MLMITCNNDKALAWSNKFSEAPAGSLPLPGLEGTITPIKWTKIKILNPTLRSEKPGDILSKQDSGRSVFSLFVIVAVLSIFVMNRWKSRNKIERCSNIQYPGTERKEPKELFILNVGGTISCRKNANGQLEPMAGVIESHVSTNADLRAMFDDSNTRVTIETVEVDANGHAKPNEYANEDGGMVYKLPDSSQIDPKLWVVLIQKLVKALESKKYCGIVVTHGTDTLAYSAAVATFAIGWLPIPIVFTAAQFPLGFPRSDADNNLYCACALAIGYTSNHNPINRNRNRNRGGHIATTHNTQGSCYMPEVLVVMNNDIFLGSRIRKCHTVSKAAFESSNGPIGTCSEGYLRITNKGIQRSTLIARLEACAGMETKLNLITILKSQHCEPMHLQEARDLLLREYHNGDLVTSNAVDVSTLSVGDEHVVHGMKLHPAMPEHHQCVLDAVYAKGVRLFVIEAFGSGNGPDVIARWIESKPDVYVSIVTQCRKGGVSNVYSASVVGSAGDDNKRCALCGDISFECAVAKIWVLGAHGFAQMGVSLRGELNHY